MKGPRDLKRYVARNRSLLKAYHWDDLMIFKLERCKKWRKCRPTQQSLRRTFEREYLP